MRHKPTKPKYTYYWHIHHDTLCEGTYNIKERIAYIKKHKPKEEIPTRLQLMTPVLHPEKLPLHFRKAADATAKTYAARDKALEASNKAYDAYAKAYAAYEKTYAACEKAYAARDKALAASTKAYDAYAKAYAAYDKALEASTKAYDAYDKASAAFDKALRMPQLEELHREEHPRCPWNGKAIFPK